VEPPSLKGRNVARTRNRKNEKRKKKQGKWNKHRACKSVCKK
jgi:hypothetical protein